MGGVGQGTGRRQVTGALGGARGWFSRGRIQLSSGRMGTDRKRGTRRDDRKHKREGRGEAETQVDRRGQTDTEGDAVPRIGTPRESGFFFCHGSQSVVWGPAELVAPRKLVRKANSQAPPRRTEPGFRGGGAPQAVVAGALWVVCMLLTEV